jgi:hypothetical protein
VPRDLWSTIASRARIRWLGIAMLATIVAVSGCTTLRQIAALRRVEFDLDRVTDVRVVGIRVDDRRHVSDLTGLELARLTAAAASGSMPLDLVVHVRARNPAENRTAARLVNLDWTLFLEERETVSGHLTGTRMIPPGETVDVPVPASLDLVPFVHGSGRDLFELALSLAGAGSSPKQIRVDLKPQIETALGPIPYPTHITIRKTVGG